MLGAAVDERCVAENEFFEWLKLDGVWSVWGAAKYVYDLNTILSKALIRFDVGGFDMNEGLVLFVKREHFISPRVLSEGRGRVLKSIDIDDRSAETTGVEITILAMLLCCSDLDLNMWNDLCEGLVGSFLIRLRCCEDCK